MMDAGKMRFRVSIERQTDVQEDSGQQKDEWLLFAERRASLEASTGSESFASQQQIARVPTVWKMRYIFGVLPLMRLRCGDKMYEVVSAVADPNKTELVITSFERVYEVA